MVGAANRGPGQGRLNKTFGFHPKFKGGAIEGSELASDKITGTVLKLVKRGSRNTICLSAIGSLSIAIFFLLYIGLGGMLS